MKKVVETIEKAATNVVSETKAVADTAVETVGKVEQALERQARRNERAFERHPFLLGFLGTLGIVSVFYGVEGIIMQVPYLVENPHIVLIFGLLLLTVTGVIYKRLQNG